MSRVRIIWSVATLWCLAGLSACSGSPAAPLCTPGITQECLCVSGESGVQSCNSAGSGFEACACAGTADVATAEADVAATPDQGPESPSERPPAGEFRVIEPGGEAICGRGGPYRFFVRGGDPTRVVLDFEGQFGGACWSVITCNIGARINDRPIFNDSVGTLEDLVSERADGYPDGLYDFDTPESPFHGWTLVRLPYCTGDLHMGSATVPYSDDLTIHHRGSENVQSVIAWLAVNYPDVQQLVSAGTGLGAFGPITYAPRLIERFPDADITVLADSGVGIITDDFFAAAFPKWNAPAVVPLDLVELTSQDFADLSMVDFYVGIASAHPSLRMAQYVTAHDTYQAWYFGVMGGAADDWHAMALQSLETIRALAPNFRYYLAPGPIHGLHPYDLLYSQEVNGVTYLDWVRQIVEGDTMPDDVICDDCRADPICAGCADASIESEACDWCEEWTP